MRAVSNESFMAGNNYRQTFQWPEAFYRQTSEQLETFRVGTINFLDKVTIKAISGDEITTARHVADFLWTWHWRDDSMSSMYNELVWLLSGNLKSREMREMKWLQHDFMPCTLGVPVTGLSLKGFDGCTMTVYPRMRNCEITSFTSDGKLQKEERALCFTAGLLWMMAKGKEYSKDSQDAEAILAHGRVDKPSKRFY